MICELLRESLSNTKDNAREEFTLAVSFALILKSAAEMLNLRGYRG